MGDRGPVPKPNPRRRNARPQRGVIQVRRPAMPRDLAPEARAEWRRVVAALDEIGALHTVDRALLIRYCNAWAEWTELDGLVRKTGRLVRGARGNLVRNPLWLMRRDVEQTLNELSTLLGISPTARLRNNIQHERPAEEASEAPTALAEYRRAMGL